MAKFDAIAKEIRRLYRENGKVLHPPDVLDAAADPDSPLHSCFTWDDGKAAHEYRLYQARQLIARVRITIPASRGETTTVRAYHALRSDRKGYRHTRDIMSGAELRDSLMAQLADDLERVRDRYESLRNVARARKLFDVIEEFCGTVKEKVPA